MKKFYWSVLILRLLSLPFTQGVWAQLPFDEIMMPKGEICVAGMYEVGKWDRYWEGDSLRRNDNIGTFTRQMAMPMIAFGLTEKVNIIASLPYIRTEPSGGNQVGQSGLQDVHVSVKVNWINKTAGNGRVLLLTNTHYSRRVGRYLSDYMPFSIGTGAPEVGLRAIGGYKLDNGFFIRAAAAYLWRGQTEIERNYYYQNGSVYSTFMNVPNAYNIHAAAGYWSSDQRLRMEATFSATNCLTGDDIRPYNRPQPTNKMEVTQIGVWTQYMVFPEKGIGTIAYFNQTLAGRNVGLATSVGVGITYQFKVY